MTTSRKLAGALGAIALVTTTAGGVGSAAADPSVPLAGSVAPFATASAATGQAPASERLTVQLWLGSDLAGAERYATEVATPGSPQWHHYLSPDAYTARFGATRSAAGAVASWMRGQGFTGVHPDAQLAYVRGAATVAQIDRALRTRIDTYRPSAGVGAGPHPLRANAGPLSLPASIAGTVIGVTGLDDAQPSRDMVEGSGHTATPCSGYYGEQTVGGLPRQFGTTTFPTIICGYTGTQMRDAYDAAATPSGAGQTIALVEEGLTRDMFLTLEDYAADNGVAAPSPQRYEELSLGPDSCGDPFDGEEQLDVEISHDMAPGATQLVVGGDSCDNGDGGNQSVFDADEAVLDGDGDAPLATVASNSWESGAESQPSAWTRIEHSYLVRAAAEGVGMYFSAGDGSGVLEPAIDPYAIGVGGTTLGIGASGGRVFETGWSDGRSVVRDGTWVLKEEDGASGGGPSQLWPQPAYQRGVVPARYGTGRVGPDIAASADPFTGMALGQLSFPSSGGAPTYSQVPIGGTSESAPLVAAMVTAAQTGESTPFGFINPAIYSLAGTSAFYPTLPLTGSSPAADRGVVCDLAEFAHICGPPSLTLATFDDQDPQMIGYAGQVTAAGYDTMTGVGTPDGPRFAAAMRGLDS